MEYIFESIKEKDKGFIAPNKSLSISLFQREKKQAWN